MTASRPALDALLHASHLWRGDSQAAVSLPSEPTGYATLDALLPGGGWPRAALTELLVPQPGIGELSLLLPVLARLSRQDSWIALVAPPHLPCAPALAAAGIDLSRLLVIRTGSGADTLWAVEQALASGACSAVLGWPSLLHERALRRWQLAVESGRGLAFHFSFGQATSSSLAALRLQLHPVPVVHAAEACNPASIPRALPRPQACVPPAALSETGIATMPRRLGVQVLKVRGHGIGATLHLDVQGHLAARHEGRARDHLPPSPSRHDAA